MLLFGDAGQKAKANKGLLFLKENRNHWCTTPSCRPSTKLSADFLFPVNSPPLQLNPSEDRYRSSWPPPTSSGKAGRQHSKASSLTRRRRTSYTPSPAIWASAKLGYLGPRLSEAITSALNKKRRS
ncbi:hypothetical protein RchiOBHm_Chr2g0136091 [Rosa chinensis]|uniref:Uncharacterized protein n=1 Tax=Rosa chinensis TaxID=74649 RepID=A0A2P6RW89_ROSCH|nr:hypothetical protein RchiOBHm_Chr2g0136091 [Rosa chinensis]